MSNHIKVKKTRKLTGYPTHSRPSLPVAQTPIPWLANCRHQDYIILLLGFISDRNSQKWHEFGAPWAGVNFLKNNAYLPNLSINFYWALKTFWTWKFSFKILSKVDIILGPYKSALVAAPAATAARRVNWKNLLYFSIAAVYCGRRSSLPKWLPKWRRNRRRSSRFWAQ